VDEGNELADARRIAEAFGCEHHELEMSATEDAVDIDDLAWRLAEPVADVSAPGFERLSRLASDHVTVALAGQGADELFGGYTKHRAAAVIGSLALLPMSVRRGLAHVPWSSSRLRPAFQALAAPDPSQRLLEMSGRIVNGMRSELYGASLATVPGGQRIPDD
jgi:asparagine synthase (glutamine-hydrolysing)